jgi:pilus assembly protein CpaE
MTHDQRISVAVLTTTERADQLWMSELEQSPQVRRLDRATMMPTGIELVQQLHPDIVIVQRPAEEAEGLVRSIYSALPDSLCIVIVDRPETSLLRRLLLAGARDVLEHPVTSVEIWESIGEVLAGEQERQTRRQSASGESRGSTRGRLALVISPKGGTGSTFVSTNLALALHQRTGGARVALGDFAMQFGHLGTHLNIFARHTLQDLAAKVDDIDDAMLDTVLQQHSSGVKVLLAPTSPDAASELSGEQIAIVLEHLLARFRYLVADGWGVLDEVTMALLARADDVLVVATPEIPALKNVKFFLDYLVANDLSRGRVSIVLNRFPSVDGVSLEDVQQHLRHPVSVNIPSAGQLVTYSINRGVPLVSSHPQSWVAQSFQNLAAYITGEQAETISMAPLKGKGRFSAAADPGRRLFKLLRGPA